MYDNNENLTDQGGKRVELSQAFRGIGYLILISVASFFLGRLLPYKLFRYDRYPFKSFPFERDGRVYLKLRINKWHNKVPDMSRIFPQMMPQKKMTDDSCQTIRVMVYETCVAELVHAALCVFALHTLELWQGVGGWIVTLAYIFVGNLPFCLIQRYNRPRFIKLMNRLEARKEKESCVH